MKFLYSIIITTFLLTSTQVIASNAPHAFKKEFTKKYKESFTIDPDGLVGIYNKYGKVNIVHSNSNEVSFEVTVVVEARNEEAAQEDFDRINIAFSSQGREVWARTEINSKENKSWSWSWNGSNSSDFKINYEVRMPKSCGLDLFNKYGNAEVPEVDGKSKFEIKYGDIHSEGVNNELYVSLGYGNGYIAHCSNLEHDIKYSKMIIGNTANLTSRTKYSKITINSADDMNCQSKYDNYKVGFAQDVKVQGKYDDYVFDEVKSLKIETKYTDLDIGRLISSGSFVLSYGGLDIGDLDAGFEEINIEGKYAHFKIRVDPGSAYRLDLSGKYADYQYPDHIKESRYVKEGNSWSIEADTGGRKGGIIKARLGYGGIKIK